MDFRFYFENQLKMHPSMQYQDVVKLCYQSAFGAEHILSDTERAKAYLCAEFESVLITDEPLFEQISPEIVRVNLGAWKREGRELDPLFEAFKKSVFINENSIEIYILIWLKKQWLRFYQILTKSNGWIFLKNTRLTESSPFITAMHTVKMKILTTE